MTRKERDLYARYLDFDTHPDSVRLDQKKCIEMFEGMFNHFEDLYCRKPNDSKNFYFKEKTNQFFQNDRDASMIVYSGPAVKGTGAWVLQPDDGPVNIDGEPIPELITFEDIVELWKMRNRSQKYLLIIIDANYSGHWTRKLNISGEPNISIQASSRYWQQSYEDKQVGGFFIHNLHKIILGKQDESIIDPLLSTHNPTFMGNFFKVVRIFGLLLKFESWADMRKALKASSYGDWPRVGPNMLDQNYSERTDEIRPRPTTRSNSPSQKANARVIPSKVTIKESQVAPNRESKYPGILAKNSELLNIKDVSIPRTTEIENKSVKRRSNSPSKHSLDGRTSQDKREQTSLYHQILSELRMSNASKLKSEVEEPINGNDKQNVSQSFVELNYSNKLAYSPKKSTKTDRQSEQHYSKPKYGANLNLSAMSKNLKGNFKSEGLHQRQSLQPKSHEHRLTNPIKRGKSFDNFFKVFSKMYNEIELPLLSDKQGNRYEGTIDTNGNKHGFGSVYSKNDGKLEYEGQFKNDTKSGKGIEYDKEGYQTYEGEWASNMKHGDGVNFDKNGDVIFRGQFADNKRNGYCNEFYPSGKLKWSGQYVDGERNGTSIEYHENGEIKIEGIWIDGKLTGLIKEYYENAVKAFEGTYANGLRNGFGRLYWETGDLHYEGSFMNGKFHGHGIIYNHNGNRLCEGQFEDGELQGHATTYYLNGNIMYDGEFEKGRAVGVGFLRKEEGKLDYQGLPQRFIREAVVSNVYKERKLKSTFEDKNVIGVNRPTSKTPEKVNFILETTSKFNQTDSVKEEILNSFARRVTIEKKQRETGQDNDFQQASKKTYYNIRNEKGANDPEADLRRSTLMTKRSVSKKSQHNGSLRDNPIPKTSQNSMASNNRDRSLTKTPTRSTNKINSSRQFSSTLSSQKNPDAKMQPKKETEPSLTLGSVHQNAISQYKESTAVNKHERIGDGDQYEQSFIGSFRIYAPIQQQSNSIGQADLQSKKSEKLELPLKNPYKNSVNVFEVDGERQRNDSQLTPAISQGNESRTDRSRSLTRNSQQNRRDSAPKKSVQAKLTIVEDDSIQTHAYNL